jgi:Putative inner membrane exporter, YdcZ
MSWLLYGFAAVAGAVNAIQVACNSTLGKALQLPFVAAMIVAAATFISLLVAGCGRYVGRARPFRLARLRAAPGRNIAYHRCRDDDWRRRPGRKVLESVTAREPALAPGGSASPQISLA